MRGCKISETFLKNKMIDNFSVNGDKRSILIKGDCNKQSTKYCIGIPTYKRVETLKETIESILAQNRIEDYYILVCDNNPERNDETELYIKSIDNSRILYYKNEVGLGMYGNINRIFELSTAPYTICIHDDDLLFPHFLFIVNQVLEKYSDIDVLCPNSVQWNPDKETKPKETLSKNNFLYKNTPLDCAITCPHPPTGIVVKTSSILKIGGFDPQKYPSSDYYFNVFASERLNVYTLHQPLYVYRWGVNATLKLDTILSFIEKDLPLKQYIIDKYAILKPFAKDILVLYSNYKMYMLKTYHQNYDTSQLTMLITKPSVSEVKHAYKFKKLLVSFLKIKHIFSIRYIRIDTQICSKI